MVSWLSLIVLTAKIDRPDFRYWRVTGQKPAAGQTSVTNLSTLSLSARPLSPIGEEIVTDCLESYHWTVTH